MLYRSLTSVRFILCVHNTFIFGKPVIKHLLATSTQSNFFFFFFLAASGLRCCAWAFSSCGERGLLFVAVHGLLIAVASLVAEHGV